MREILGWIRAYRYFCLLRTSVEAPFNPLRRTNYSPPHLEWVRANSH
jgi:hypothetical protein